MSAERVTDGPEQDRRYIWEQAALEAEVETGRREETEQAARASLLVRVCRICAGTVVLLFGIALLVLPGPGTVVIAGGLSILAIDVPFARRLLHKVRRRLPQDADGDMPRWLVLAMSGSLVVAVAASAAVMIA